MKNLSINFNYTVYNSLSELNTGDSSLLKAAMEVTRFAYAPYSHFNVGAAARLSNGEIVKGTNQENASYPVGICAERSLLSTAASLFPGMAIETMAISYDGEHVDSSTPVAPCGMCRQALLEFEGRTNHPIRLIMAGKTGEVIVIEKCSHLLPFSFNKEDLGGSK